MGGGRGGQKSIGNVTKKIELYKNLDFFEIIKDVFHTYIFEQNILNDRSVKCRSLSSIKSEVGWWGGGGGGIFLYIYMVVCNSITP